MKSRLHHVFCILLGVAAVFASQHSSAQEPKYRLVEVGGRVSLEVPSHWYLADLEERKNNARLPDGMESAAGEKLGPARLATLVVRPKPDPASARVMVFFVENWNESQSDLREALRSNRTRTMQAVTDAFHEDMTGAAKMFAKQGVTLLGQEAVATDSIGGAIAFTLTYRRKPSGTKDDSPLTEIQYHVPMGTQKIIITFSYRESEARLLRPILDRVRRSVAIQ